MGSLDSQQGPHSSKALDCLVEGDGFYPAMAEELWGNSELTCDLMTELPGQHRPSGQEGGGWGTSVKFF